MDGRELPNKNFPFPLSQTVSSFDRDDTTIFSALAAACGSNGSPSAGPRTLFITNFTAGEYIKPVRSNETKRPMKV